MRLKRRKAAGEEDMRRLGARRSTGGAGSDTDAFIIKVEQNSLTFDIIKAEIGIVRQFAAGGPLR